MFTDEWRSVTRIMLFALRTKYFPVRISPVFVLSALFGEDCVDKELLIQSFLQYISNDEKPCVSSMLENYKAGGKDEDELFKILSAYKCYRRPSAETIKELICELSH